MTFYELLRPRGTKDFAESKILQISDVVNITFYNFTILRYYFTANTTETKAYCIWALRLAQAPNG